MNFVGLKTVIKAQFSVSNSYPPPEEQSCMLQDVSIAESCDPPGRRLDFPKSLPDLRWSLPVSNRYILMISFPLPSFAVFVVAVGEIRFSLLGFLGASTSAAAPQKSRMPKPSVEVTTRRWLAINSACNLKKKLSFTLSHPDSLGSR